MTAENPEMTGNPEKSSMTWTAALEKPENTERDRFSDEQVQDIKKAFDCFDTDGSGAIDHNEMAKGEDGCYCGCGFSCGCGCGFH